MEKIMEDYQVMTVEGFDSDGEPEIRLYDDGKIEVMFNFMPPSNGNPDLIDNFMFDSFEMALENALGVKVTREDRELFLIDRPKLKTTVELKQYLETFWDQIKV
jgi:hypothetical protein